MKFKEELNHKHVNQLKKNPTKYVNMAIDDINFKKISNFEGRKKKIQECSRIKGFIFQREFQISKKKKNNDKKILKWHQKIQVFPFEN